MNAYEFEVLKERVSRLEAKNRLLSTWLHVLFVILIPFLFYVAVVRLTSTGVIKAKTIELAGESGKARVWLGQVPDGSLGIKVDDASGETRANLSLNSIGVPEFYLNDLEGHQRVSITMSMEGNPQVQLYGKEYRKLVDLYVYKETPSLNLYDSMNRWRAVFGLSEDDGSALLTFMKTGSHAEAMLYIDDEGKPRLSLTGPDNAYTTIKPK